MGGVNLKNIYFFLHAQQIRIIIVAQNKSPDPEKLRLLPPTNPSTFTYNFVDLCTITSTFVQICRPYFTNPLTFAYNYVDLYLQIRRP